METLGVWLRQTREAAGITLEEAEAATHVRRRFLERLENGEFDAFPGGDVQIRGFLRLYARYLNLSPEKAVTRYDGEVHAARSGAPDKRSAPVASTAVVTSSGDRRVGRERILIFGVGAVLLAVVAFLGWYAFARPQDENPSSLATVTVGATEMTTGQSGTPSPSTLTPTIAPLPDGGVSLTLEATEHVWASVSVDGELALEGMLEPSQVESWTADEAIVLRTGNGAGLLVAVNTQPLGTLGERGEVVTRGWGPEGELATSAIDQALD